MGKIVLIFFTIVTLAVIGLYFFTTLVKEQQLDNSPTTITVWGTPEEETAIKAAADEYKKNRPNVTINFVSQSLQNYRTRVQTQILSGTGPDIFIMHNTWRDMFLQAGILSAAPSSIISKDEFDKTFYPVAGNTLTAKGKVYAIPREVDGLALYYNEEMLKGQGLNVPTTWLEFVDAANKTTVVDQKGNIVTAGAALGTTDNIDYWSDILGLLFYQQYQQFPQYSINKPNNDKGVEVLTFYTKLAKDPKSSVWNSTMENSTQAFAHGKLAFYFAPESEIPEIKKMNSNLPFKVAPVPQLPGVNTPVGWGTFWAYGVSSKSGNEKESWRFAKFLSSMDAQKAMFDAEKKVNGVGFPYSRVDLKNELESDPLLGAFVKQGPSYTSWYLSFGTQDQSLNDDITKIFKTAVDSTLNNGDPASALKAAEASIQQEFLGGSRTPQ